MLKGLLVDKKIRVYITCILIGVLLVATLGLNGITSGATELATPQDAVEVATPDEANEAAEVDVENMESANDAASYTDADSEEIMDTNSLVHQPGEGEPSITYSVHCQKYGWMTPVSNGAMAGTSGESKRLEAICIGIDSNGAVDEEGNPLTGGIRYRTHVQNYGWQDWVSSEIDGDSVTLMIDDYIYAGTMGESKRLEGIEIELTGDIAKYYDVYYRTHVQGYGWMNAVSNGNMSGTTGESKRLEAIEISLVKKNQQVSATLTYSVHGQGYGWTKEITPELGEYNSSTVAGTVGQSRRLEAIVLKVETTGVTGGIECSAHVQNYGWMDAVRGGEIAGTTGESKRMEAVSINLTGTISVYYDIYYRVHVQSLGWLDWARNGQKAGTQGIGRRIEAVQVLLVEKGDSAPGSTTRPFYNCSNGNWGILPGSLKIRVNKQMNCITVYKGSVPIKAIVCSTGYATPVGNFDIKQKWRWKELIHDVYGQYSCHITGDILFHSVPYDDPNNRTLLTSEYNKLGQTASAGCIRLTTRDAKWIYDNCPTGTPVEIYNSSDPGPLGKPSADKLPPGQNWDPTDPEFN